MLFKKMKGMALLDFVVTAPCKIAHQRIFCFIDNVKKNNKDVTGDMLNVTRDIDNVRGDMLIATCFWGKSYRKFGDVTPKVSFVTR